MVSHATVSAWDETTVGNGTFRPEMRVGTSSIRMKAQPPEIDLRRDAIYGSDRQLHSSASV